ISELLGYDDVSDSNSDLTQIQNQGCNNLRVENTASQQKLEQVCNRSSIGSLEFQGFGDLSYAESTKKSQKNRTVNVSSVKDKVSHCEQRTKLNYSNAISENNICDSGVNPSTKTVNDLTSKVVSENSPNSKKKIVPSDDPQQIVVENEWNVVKFKRRSSKRIHNQKLDGNGMVGAGEIGSGLLTGEKRAWFHLGKIKRGTSVADVESFLTSAFPEFNISVEKLNSKGIYESFKLGIDFIHREKISNPLLWPKNVILRRFFIFETQSKSSRLITDNDERHVPDCYETVRMNLALVNVQCLRTKFNVVCSFVDDCDLDVLCVCEHWLNPMEKELYQCLNDKSGLCLASTFCRTNYKNGGVAIYVRSIYIFKIIDLNKFCSEKDCELCGIELPNVSMIIICVYRSPNGCLETFLTIWKHV
ncbi:hypothetical protein LSTR_LSTR017063, partial [Laodelphax striatellus]